MNIENKLQDLLVDENKLNEWIGFYRRNDPIFNYVTNLCENKITCNETILKLAIVAILDQKTKNATDLWSKYEIII